MWNYVLHCTREEINYYYYYTEPYIQINFTKNILSMCKTLLLRSINKTINVTKLKSKSSRNFFFQNLTGWHTKTRMYFYIINISCLDDVTEYPLLLKPLLSSSKPLVLPSCKISKMFFLESGYSLDGERVWRLEYSVNFVVVEWQIGWFVYQWRHFT